MTNRYNELALCCCTSFGTAAQPRRTITLLLMRLLLVAKRVPEFGCGLCIRKNVWHDDRCSNTKAMNAKCTTLWTCRKSWFARNCLSDGLNLARNCLARLNRHGPSTITHMTSHTIHLCTGKTRMPLIHAHMVMLSRNVSVHETISAILIHTLYTATDGMFNRHVASCQPH